MLTCLILTRVVNHNNDAYDLNDSVYKNAFFFNKIGLFKEGNHAMNNKKTVIL